MSLDAFWIACDKFGTACGKFLTRYWNRVSDSATETQQKVKPLVNTTYKAGIALYTTYTTAVICISILPIVISSMAIFATLPYFSEFSTSYVYGLGLVVASAAGFFKYQDVIHREELDNQITQNKAQIDKLNKRLHRVKTQLKHSTKASSSKKDSHVTKPAVNFGKSSKASHSAAIPKSKPTRKRVSPLPIPV